MKIPSLGVGQQFSSKQISDLFECSVYSGMCRSLRTNTLVLISKQVNGLYHDRWIGTTLHYTGMGQRGDQRIDRSQNKTLAESNSNGVAIHLFEVHVDGVYTYVGRVKLSDAPYEEVQPDVDGLPRRVWVFPLVVVDGLVPSVPEILQSRQEARSAKQAKRLSDDEVRHRAMRARPQPGQRPSSTMRYQRDPHVVEYAKRRAKGSCELCEEPAPFSNGDGEPYLETHHIVWLANGGADTVNNTVALCPNCHRKMHILNLPTDQTTLKKRADHQGE